ncbi:MAG TPA: MFS transporter [Methylomirabilota bacterium]|nr:MFS transporter [Methylomirabilota bacterium]
MTPPRESLASQRLWLAFATMLLVAGITNTFPVFLPALLADFGGSRAATSATASLLWIGGALLSPIAGYLVAHWNPRRLVCLGLAIVAGGMLIGSAAPTLPLFLLAMGVGGGIGLGLTGMTTHAALIADAYVRRRGLATGIAFGGPMAAYALAPPAQWIITHWGWRPAFWCYAGAILALIPWAWRAHPTRLASVRGGGAPGSTEVTLRGIVRSAGFLEPARHVHHPAALRLPRHHAARSTSPSAASPRARPRGSWPSAACWPGPAARSPGSPPTGSAVPPRASGRSRARWWGWRA